MIRAWILVFQVTIVTLALSEAVDLYCYKGNLSSIQIEAIEDAANFITSNCIDTDLQTVFFASGFGTNNISMDTLNYTSALLRAGNRNVVYLNWSKEAYTSNSTTVTLDYLNAFKNVYEVGCLMADALEILVDNGLDMDMVELAGHSLGAHVMGVAGVRIRQLKTSARLLRAYDPARPLYTDNPMAVNSSCAKCVVAIHSDPGNYGLNKTLGQIDIFLNYGLYLNGTDAQPGCTAATVANQMHLENLCSHYRAPLIGANAILNPGMYLALQASDYNMWVEQNGTGADVIDLGDNLDLTASGKYFMSTNAQDPFGKGIDGLRP